MYAIINSGDKQFRVRQGDRLRVPKVAAAIGESVRLSKVLMLVDGDDVRVGQPYLDDARVEAKVSGHVRGPKIRIIKMKRRKHSVKRMGHRQDYSELRITQIATGQDDGS